MKDIILLNALILKAEDNPVVKQWLIDELLSIIPKTKDKKRANIKWTVEQIEEIRGYRAEGLKVRVIADLMGVSLNNMSQIIHKNKL